MTKVVIAGSGLIGRAFAAAFLRGGMDVVLWSRRETTVHEALAFLNQCLPVLETEGLLNGQHAVDLLARVSIATKLEDALPGAAYIQESFPETLEAKRAIYEELDRLSEPDAIIASSSAGLLASQFTEHLPGRHRCLVAHPINPPYLIPATEVVPAPWTDPGVVDRTCELLRAAGQAPVVLAKEIDGFVVNRLQGALLNEAFWLVANGYARPDDIDVALKHGLALRWSFIGPFETIDLNAPQGVRDYAERYNQMYGRLHAQMRDRADWTGALLDDVVSHRRDALALSQLPERQLWRDRRLMALARHKREADDEFGA